MSHEKNKRGHDRKFSIPSEKLKNYDLNSVC